MPSKYCIHCCDSKTGDSHRISATNWCPRCGKGGCNKTGSDKTGSDSHELTNGECAVTLRE